MSSFGSFLSGKQIIEIVRISQAIMTDADVKDKDTMNKISGLCCYFLLLFSLTNCTEEVKQYEKLVFDKENAICIQDYEMPICDSVMLETRDDALVNVQSKMCFDGKSYFLSNSNCVCRFDEKGCLKSVIGALGHGRGEYERMLDFTLNSDRNTVDILAANAIYSYKYEGSFVERKQITIPANSLCYNDGLYYLSTGNNTCYSKKCVSVCDGTLKMERELVEIGHDVNAMTYDFGAGEYLTFSFLYSHKAYRLCDGDVAYIYDMDFKNLKIPSELYDEKLDLVKAADIMYRNNFAMVNQFLENQKYIYVQVLESQANTKDMLFYHWFVNKETGKNVIIKNDASYYDTYNANPQYLSKDNKLYFVGSMNKADDNSRNPAIVVVDVSKVL